jgi:hypothetical protein
MHSVHHEPLIAHKLDGEQDELPNPLFPARFKPLFNGLED